MTELRKVSNFPNGKAISKFCAHRHAGPWTVMQMSFPQKHACILKKQKTPWFTVQGHATTPAYGNESKMCSFTHLQDISIASHYHWPFANIEHWPELGFSHRKLLLQKPKNIWDTWCNKKITNGTCILSRHGLLKTHQTVILHTWFLTSILLVCIMERSYHNNNTFCHGNICSMKSIIHLFFLSILVKSNHSKCFSL